MAIQQPCLPKIGGDFCLFSIAYTEHWVQYYIFSPDCLFLWSEEGFQFTDYENLWKSSEGKEIPFPKAGEDSHFLLSPSSTVVFMSQLKGISYMGWPSFLVCWIKWTGSHCPCSWSKPWACIDNTEYRFNSEHLSAHQRCQSQVQK